MTVEPMVNCRVREGAFFGCSAARICRHDTGVGSKRYDDLGHHDGQSELTSVKKYAIQSAANWAGMDMSAYVLSKALPPAKLREAAARVAVRAGVNPDWLNDGLQSSMSGRGDFAPFLEFDHLKVMVAQPAYLLAKKCLAMRIGAELHDYDDIRFLLRLLDRARRRRAPCPVSPLPSRV